MKNIFEYADKELAQDSFLRCLFESYEDEEVKPILYSFLKKYCDFTDEECIEGVWTFPQWNKIDIAVWMKTSQRASVALFIEDKTFSNEHNQLVEYNAHIDYRKEKEDRYKVFYKTNRISDYDKKGIDEANGKKYIIKWQICDIDNILEIFRCCENSKNILLKWYIEYIRQIKNALDNTEMPESHSGKLDYIKWQSYFEKIKTDLNVDECLYDCWVEKAGQYPYVCFKIKKKNLKYSLPYLEIRSRDCLNKNFRVLILCYGVKDDYLSKRQDVLIEKIKSRNEFKCEKLVKSHRGKKIYPKQIGELKLEKVEKEDFFNCLQESFSEYSEIMECE